MRVETENRPMNEDETRYRMLWAGLSREQKDALIDLAEVMGDTGNMRSLRELLRAQVKISSIVATREHLAWFWRVFLKVGTAAGVVVGCIGVWKTFFEK